MTRRISSVVASALFAMSFAAAGSAQPVRSFDALADTLAPGDRIVIEDASGTKTVGRLVRVTRDEIGIDGGTAGKRFARDEVRTVGRRERLTQVGTFVGAAIGASIGGYQYCRGSGEHPECADAMVLLGGIGCGIGALAGLAIPRTRIIFRSSEPRVYLAPRLGPHAAAVVAIRRW